MRARTANTPPLAGIINGQPEAPKPGARPRIPPGAFPDVLLLASIWIASLLVVNPLGDFPLNDDWAFGLSVKRLLQTGDFRPVGWTGMPLISQTLWGSLFCLPGGFSFTALRLSTLVLSLCGCLLVYLLVRQVHPSRWLAAFSALTVGFNPMYYALSNTFMTDVPFMAFLLGAAWFFCRNLQHGSDVDLVCGTACALAATLCRQPGLAAPLAFLICLLWSRGLSVRWVIRSLVPLFLCLGGLLAYDHWLRSSGRLPALYTVRTQSVVSMLCSPRQLVPGLAKHIGTALLYLGWFALPVMVLVWPTAAEARRARRAAFVAGCVGLTFVLCSIVGLARLRGPMPTEGNIILAQGIGPLSLRDVHILNLPHLPTIGKGFWLAVTAVSVLGGASLLGAAAAMAATLRRSTIPARIQPDRAVGLFCLVCTGIYLAPFLVIGGWDRYYLPPLPLLLVGIAALTAGSWARPAGARLPLALLLLASLTLFAVLATKDYLAWNRARWTALNDLLADRKVTAADVDGGFEFNGWYLYDPAYKETPGKSWYWVDRDSYLLAFADMPGYRTVKEYPYTHWLPPYAGKILVLRKAVAAEPKPDSSSRTPTPGAAAASWLRVGNPVSAIAPAPPPPTSG
jgi:hypothetical protein